MSTLGNPVFYFVAPYFWMTLTAHTSFALFVPDIFFDLAAGLLCSITFLTLGSTYLYFFLLEDSGLMLMLIFVCLDIY